MVIRRLQAERQRGKAYQPHFGQGEIVAAWLGGLLAISALGLISSWSRSPLMVAPFGASTVLLFANPASALSQPRNIVLGNSLGALVSTACVAWIGPTPWGMGLAVGLTIALGQRLRCLHPPRRCRRPARHLAGGQASLRAQPDPHRLPAVGDDRGAVPQAAARQRHLSPALAVNNRRPGRDGDGRGNGGTVARMDARLRMGAALAALGLAALALAATAWAADCRALKDQRDRVGRQAMQAEIALLQALRQRLCPEQEALANEGNALSHDHGTDVQIDYGAYIHCRHRAEAQLQSSRPVLYRNRLAFTFYTAEGARLAREADELKAQLERQCPSAER